MVISHLFALIMLRVISSFILFLLFSRKKAKLSKGCKTSTRDNDINHGKCVVYVRYLKTEKGVEKMMPSCQKDVKHQQGIMILIMGNVLYMSDI